MKLLEKILVPVDLLHSQQPQVDLAAELAQKFSSELTLLQVLPPEAETGSLQNLLSGFVDKEFGKITGDLREKGIRFSQVVRYGDVFDQVREVAEKENSNLILIETQFQKDRKKYTIDIVIEKLIRKTDKPVWVLKESSGVLPRQILCPVDFSDASRRALKNALKISRIFDAELHVLNVFEPMLESFAFRLNVDYQEENQRLEVENQVRFMNFLEKEDFTDVNFKTQMLKGTPHQKIIEYAESNLIDLIFIGATGKSFLQRVLIGSVTEMIIQRLPCSIVINKTENLLKLVIDSDITDLEKHFNLAKKLEKAGYYQEAIEQYKLCLRVNDLHIPALNELSALCHKTGDKEMAAFYKQKMTEILRRLWDKKIELEIRKRYKIKD